MEKLLSFRHLLIFLSLIIHSMQAGQRFGSKGGSGYTLSCLSVNCQVKWDPNCCSGAQQGIGRSIQPLANWRFGSIFRNSIPPVRPYNPPSFEDIFETDHKRFLGESTTVNPHRFSLHMNPFQKFSKQSNQQENVFKFSNKFDEFSEMDRNSESESTTDKYFSSLNKLKEKQQQVFFGNIHETSTKPYRKQRTSTKKYDNIKQTIKPYSDFEATTIRYNKYKTTTLKSVDDLRKETFLQKAKEELREKQRLKSLYIKAKQAKNKLKSNGINPEISESISYLQKPIKEVVENNNNFHKDDFQTNFNIVEYKKERKERIQVKKQSDETKKSEKQKAYEAKLARWQQKKAKLSKKTRQKYIDKSQETIIMDDKAGTAITSPVVTVTYTPTTTEKIKPIKEQLTDRISQEENENEIENFVKKEKGSNYKEKENQDNPFTEELCQKLRVPCRFVTEHPCCKLPQRIEMVGRARAMDGSADLRWRFLEKETRKALPDQHVVAHNSGGPRNGPQGRMINGFNSQSISKQPSSFSVNSLPNDILYNHSKSKDRVLVPRYHYDGGPQLTTTILRQCWRLTYLDCQLEPEHPCCALTSAKNNRLVGTMSSNVLDKWLRRQ